MPYIGIRTAIGIVPLQDIPSEQFAEQLRLWHAANNPPPKATRWIRLNDAERKRLQLHVSYRIHEPGG